MMFFCAFFIHSNHVSEHYSGVGLQECHICHQGTDSPPLSAELSVAIIAINFTIETLASRDNAKPPYFGLAQLRAPPHFL